MFGTLILKIFQHCCFQNTTMEQQLEIVLKDLVGDTPVKYLVDGGSTGHLKDNELHIEKYKLDTCPDETQILNALQKRIGRSEALKSQKYTLGICVLLLLSRRYCVSSSTLPGIEDSFIERCWECIHVVSQNIPIKLSQWIVDTMANRTPSGYSVLFCTSRQLLSSVDLLKNSISGNGKFLNIDSIEFDVPSVVWHRNDAIHQTVILHLKLQDRDLS